MGKKSAFFIVVPALVICVLLLLLLIPAVQRARVQANRAVSSTTIKGIDSACYLYAQKNDGNWPDSLESLVEQGYLEAKALVNPNRPDLKVGYVYIKPARPWDERPRGLMVIYEAHEEWGQGIETSAGFIEDEKDFKKLLAEAKKYAVIEGNGD